MSNPNELAPGEQRYKRRLAAVTAAAALLVAAGALVGSPSGSAAVLASGKGGIIALQDPPPAAANSPSGTYQLRCWQHGRLLFDEGPVTLAPEARRAAKLVAFDRHGAPLVVSDTGGTTCLARPSPPAASLALPH